MYFWILLITRHSVYVDPVPTKAYISGEANTTKLVELNKPATVRCLAGGYPKPIVSWWRGTEILPLRSTRFEVNRDYSLVFNQIGLIDLGPYICQAYSGEGKPVSVSIVLKAIGPAHANDENEEQYLKYIIDAPTLPVTQAPLFSYPITTPRENVVEIGKCLVNCSMFFVVCIFPMISKHHSVTHPHTNLRQMKTSNCYFQNTWYFFPLKEPVSTHISLPNGNTFSVGSDISIQCDVRGYPQPLAAWFKDDVEIQQSQRIRISGKSTNFPTVKWKFIIHSPIRSKFRCSHINHLWSNNWRFWQL